MQLTPVESSHIDSIGYLDAHRVLLVAYRDGALRARPDVSPEEYAAIMEAPSKGAAVAKLIQPSILVRAKDGSPAQSAISYRDMQAVQAKPGKDCGFAVIK